MKNAFQDEGFLWDLLSMESMESHWLLAMQTAKHAEASLITDNADSNWWFFFSADM